MSALGELGSLLGILAIVRGERTEAGQASGENTPTQAKERPALYAGPFVTD